MTNNGKLAASLWAVAVLISSKFPAHAARDLASVVAEVDNGFVCPEFLANDDARRGEMMNFSKALAAVGPKRLTYQQASYIRAKILERHNCARGGGSMAANGNSAVQQAAVSPVAPAEAASASLQP